MFHNSTTIWHNPVAKKSLFKERRVVGIAFKFTEFLGKSLLYSTKAIGTAFKAGWKLSYPVRLPGILLWEQTRKLYQYALKGIDGAEWGVRTTREAATGVFKDGVGGGLWKLAKGPLGFLYENFVSNTRTVLGDTVKIVKAPKEGFDEGVSDMRSAYGELFSGMSVKNPWQSTKALLGKALSPWQTTKSIGKAALSTVAMPYKIGAKTASAVWDMPQNIAINTANSIDWYRKGIQGAFAGEHFKEAYDRVKAAPATASKEMTDNNRWLNFNRGLGRAGKGIKDISVKNYQGASKWWQGFKGKIGGGAAMPAAAPA